MALLFAGTSLADFTIDGGSSSGPPTVVTGSTVYANVAEGIRFRDPTEIVHTDIAYQNDLWVSFYVQCASQFAQRACVAFYDTNSAAGQAQPIYSMEITAGTTPKTVMMRAWNGTTMTNLATAAGAITTGTLSRVDIHIKKADSGGVADIYVGGTLQFTFSGDTNIFTSSGINRVGFTQFTSGNNNCDISAVIIADEDTRAMVMAQSRPTGAGGVTQWSGTWAEIDETGYTDTDLIAESTLNEVSTFTKTALPAGFSGLTCVGMVLALRAQANTGFDAAPAVRVSGTTYSSGDFNLTPGYKPAQAILTTNPATGAAWTYSEANAAEIGVKLTT